MGEKKEVLVGGGLGGTRMEEREREKRKKDVLAASGKSLIVGGTDCAARIGEFEGVGG